VESVDFEVLSAEHEAVADGCIAVGVAFDEGSG
jgi:hypothetical protein